MPLSTAAARRYAEAAFDLAHVEGDLDGWSDELRRVAAIGADEQAASALDNPTIPATEREEAVSRALEGQVRDQVLRLATLAVRRGRASVLPGVSREFDRLLDRERGVVSAVVTSATELSAADAKAVSERVAALRGASSVRLEQRVDESLIGGLTVRIGDRLIDASVRGRLERLRSRIVAGGAGALEDRTTT
ncbi:MAG TPA: ATP synthase F1 subunit delta [Candidatus Limnocylindrales bacterium]|nr:ATP synthase F1 subunit delta [Candidatus Limnocylindrales bacterium]